LAGLGKPWVRCFNSL